MDQGSLYLEVNAGLCNRLRAMVSGICWAERLRRKLYVCWPSWKPECGATFSNLFDGRQFPDWIEVIDTTLTDKQQCLSPADAAMILNTTQSSINIQSHGCFWPRKDRADNEQWLYWLRQLQPSQQVIHVLSSWTKSLAPDSVTVHVRRTDNQKAIRLSPMNRFLLRLDQFPPQFFILVFSDDIEAVDDIRRVYGFRVLAPEVVRKRNTLDGMIEATAAFFAIARSKHVIGSANSSFSEVACDYGNVNLEIVSQGL
jgi:hypothetical protein